MNKKSYYIILTMVCMYFCFYALKALLIVYLSQELQLDDDRAISLFGAVVTLSFLFPVLGGVIADKLMGRQMTTIVGLILLCIGSCILAHQLILGCALIAMGFGIGKAAIVDLFGYTLSKSQAEQDKAYTWLYASGSIGATLGVVSTGMISIYHNTWAFSFYLSGVAALIGIIPALLANISEITKNTVTKFKQILAWFVLGLVVIVTFYMIKTHSISIIIIFTSAIALILMVQIFIKNSECTLIMSIIVYTLISFLYWVLNQLDSSSLALFIDRNIDRNFLSITLPTSIFQSINPIAIIIFGTVLGLLWQRLEKNEHAISNFFKLSLGILLLGVSFLFITLGAKSAMLIGHASVLWVIFGLALAGISELFIDPVVLAKINKLKENTAILTGIYFLVTGALSNYASLGIAKFAGVSTGLSATASALIYFNVYHKITIVLFALLAVIIAFWCGLVLVKRKRVRLNVA